MDAIIAGKVGNISNRTVFTALSVEENIVYDTSQYFTIPSEKANAVLIRYKEVDFMNQQQLTIKTFSQTYPTSGVYNTGYQFGEDYFVVYGSQTSEPFYTKFNIGIGLATTTSVVKTINISSQNRYTYLSNYITSVEIGTLEIT